MTQRSPQPLRSLLSPYPLLDKIDDPALFKGRDESVDAIGHLLQSNGLRVVVLHAPSGTGKTSFLHAGLKPALEKQRCVVIESAFHTQGLARRLLVPLGFDEEIPDNAPARFVAALDQFNENNPPPLFVLDAFESAFRGQDRDEVLARVGLLLGMTAKRGRACQWMIAIRDDAYGQVRPWLSNVLANVERLGWPRPNCPFNLQEAPDFAHFPLPPFGSPSARAGAEGRDPQECAKSAFLAAIRAPIDLPKENDEPRYALRFEDGAAEAIADAFARERSAHPQAPLVTVLQIVLDHLFTSTPAVRGMRTIAVDPDELPNLIRDALANHLHRKLTTAFPFRPWNFAETHRAKSKRTRAFLLLLRLAQENHATGLGDDDIAALKWPDGQDLVKSLLDHRLLRREWNEALGAYRIHLPHNALVEHLLTLSKDPKARARYELDTKLVELSRIVATLVKFHERGEREGTTLTEALYEEIAADIHSLPKTKGQDAWWEECKIKIDDDKLRRQKRHRLFMRLGVGFVMAIGAITLLGYVTVVPEHYRAAIRHAHDDSVAAKAFGAWNRLPGHEVGARKAFAEYLVRKSLKVGAQGHLDEAILWRLKALEMHDTPDERLAIAYLTSAWPEDAFVLQQPRGTSVRTSPNGDRMLVPVRDGFELRSTQDGRKIGTITPVGPHEYVRFNPDGMWLHALSKSRVQVWSAKDGKPHGQPLVANIEQVEVNADGSLALLCGAQGIFLWDVNAGKERGTVLLAKPGTKFGCLRRSGDEELPPWAWSPDGKTFAILDETRIGLWEANRATERQHWDLHPFAASALRFDAPGERLVAHTMDQARILVPSTPHESGIPVRNPDSILRASVTEKPPRLILTGYATITAWSMNTGQLEKTWPRLCGSTLTSVRAEGDFVTEMCGSEVIHHDENTRQPLRSTPCPTKFCMSATLDAGVPVMVGKDGWEPESFVVVRGYREIKGQTVVFRHDPSWGGPEVTEDNQYVLMVSPLQSTEKDPNKVNGDARFLHIDTGELSQMEFAVRHERLAKPVITSEAGDWVVVEDPSGVKLVDRRTGFLGCEELFRTPKLHAVLSSDGSTLATWDGSAVSQWDVATCATTGKTLPLSGKWTSPEAVVFSKDDRFLGIVAKKEFEVWPVGDHAAFSGPLVGWDGAWTRKAWTSVLGRNLTGYEEGSRVMMAFLGVSGKRRPKSVRPPCYDAASSLWHVTKDEQWIVFARQQSLHLYHYNDCNEHGAPIQLDDAPVAIDSDAQSGTLAVATGRWVHFLRMGAEGLEIRATRPLAQQALAMTNITTVPMDPTYRVLTGKGKWLLGAETVAAEPPKSVDWITGTPESLSKQWSRRLARQIGANLKVEIIGTSPSTTAVQQ